MEELQNKMRNGTDVRAHTQYNHSFHMCLIKMSKSETIKDMYLRLGTPLLRVQSLSFGCEGNISKSVKEHEIILKLLKEDNLTELSAVLSQHNKDVISNIQKKLHS
ncbi:FCD domain-containing protein [Sporosarcina sp. GW1-11]|nr:FCD domain-containing protein [Sporosarcina sp. GW1-11]MDV6378582.1 FCD domain-containing protein [Sporosarcina sp. GW1-11]